MRSYELVNFDILKKYAILGEGGTSPKLSGMHHSVNNWVQLDSYI